jgi:hypothetical protein
MSLTIPCQIPSHRHPLCAPLTRRPRQTDGGIAVLVVQVHGTNNLRIEASRKPLQGSLINERQSREFHWRKLEAEIAARIQRFPLELGTELRIGDQSSQYSLDG